MNERIKELAKQSGVVYDWDPGTSGPEVYFDRQEDFEKFAELLIRECAMIVEGFTIEQEVALDDYQEYEASAVLKEHFGVEE